MKFLYCHLAGDIVGPVEGEYPANRCEICENDCDISNETILLALRNDLATQREKGKTK